MPNLLNGLVNGWVKVNSKHIIFPREEGHSRRERRDSEAGGSLDGSSSKLLDRSRGKSSRKHGVSHQTVTTASTQGTMDPEALAIKKFNSKRQNKRRLQRTISHSDLLREMANGGGDDNNMNRTKSSERLSTRNASNSRTTSYDSNRVGNRKNDESVRLVAGFFGSDVGDDKRTNGGAERRATHRSGEATLTQSGRSQNGPVTTGKYLNEAMFVQQLEGSKAGRRSNSSSVVGSSASERSPIRESYNRPSGDSSAPQHELEHRLRSLESDSRGINDDSGLSKARQRQHGHSASSAPPHGDPQHQCAGCNDMESQLLAAYDDIRYLRDVSLRSEYNKAPSKPKNSILRGSNYELTTLADASKRLTEVTGRHRRQIEQMTRETSRKQSSIHFNHSKMSMICKTLNDESSIRKQEALDLQEEVRDLKAERDMLATDVQRLRTEASLHKQEQLEHGLLRERMKSYETHSLERADKAIRERDNVIMDLSTNLERTLETLEIEREQQRQRRQIIFPGQQASADESSAPPNVTALQEELKKAKEAARNLEALLEATRTEAAKRETALTVRCENLERRLESATPPLEEES